jgi:hypothetical protein
MINKLISAAVKLLEVNPAIRDANSPTVMAE